MGNQCCGRDRGSKSKKAIKRIADSPWKDGKEDDKLVDDLWEIFAGKDTTELKKED